MAPRGVARSHRGSGAMQGLPRHTPTVSLTELVDRVVHASYGELTSLANALPGQPEPDRRRELARFLHVTKQRLARLGAIAEWAPVQRRAQISVTCGDMLGQLAQHDAAFTDGADRLFALHSQLAWAKAPLYDLPGALDVLCRGRYTDMPHAAFEEVKNAPKAAAAREGAPKTEAQVAEEAKQQRAKEDREKRFNAEIRGRLLEVEAGVATGGTKPRAMKVWEISRGQAIVGVPGEYRAVLTLGGPPPLAVAVALALVQAWWCLV